MKILQKIRVFFLAIFSTEFTFPVNHDSFKFLGMDYQHNPSVPLNINDRVCIHPVPGVSQATKIYPGKVVALEAKWYVNGKSINQWTIFVEGIGDNKAWKAVMNDYLFGRLEFVERNYKGK